MSTNFTLPIKKNFVMQLHTAISKFKESQAHQPGSSFVSRFFLIVVLSCSLFLVGSCNEKVEVHDFIDDKYVLSDMSKGQMVRHSYKIQTALRQSPSLVTFFSDKELTLALSKPDLMRREGEMSVWQYVGETCVLDIYWAQKSKDDIEQIYYEFHPRRKLLQTVGYDEDIQEWECMQSILQDRRKKIQAGYDDVQAVLDLNEQRL